MTLFAGVDPDGLVGLADTADQYAQRLELARAEILLLLDRPSPAGTSRVHQLTAAGEFLGDRSRELRWRARIVAEGEQIAGVAPLGRDRWLREFAGHGVFTLDSWTTEFDAWVGPYWLRDLCTRSPAAVAEAFAAIGSERSHELAIAHPDLVGNLDGAPAALRYLANRARLAAEVDRLEDTAAKLGYQVDERLPGSTILAGIEERTAEYQTWLDEERQIILFDPRGDGRAAEVFGDLEAADSVAVLVPGMANDLRNFSTARGGFRTDALALWQAAGETGTAAIAWLGYDTPDGIDAVSRSAAEQAAPALASFIRGVDPAAQHRVTVIAHSYGSVVAGIAAATGLDVDDLVLVGSPGTTLSHASEAMLREGGRVWAALAPGDPIGIGVDPQPRWWYSLHPVLPVLAFTGAIVKRDTLWHGANPADDTFGARRIATVGSSGHGSYFEAGTLANLAHIVAGNYDQVVLAGSS